MKYTYNILLVFFFSIVLSSCGKESNPFKDNFGYYKFSFKEDNSAVEKTKTMDPIFSVKVLNSEGVIVKTYADHRVLETEPLKLKAGKYSLEASTGESIEAGFAKPFYKGNTEFVVQSGSTGSANVVCTLANVKVTVQLDPSVTENFKECVITISNTKNNGTLIYSSDNGSIDKEGYFNCTGVLNWNMYLVNNNDVIFSDGLKGTINDVKPREHYKLKFKLSDDPSNSGIDVSVGVDPTTNEQIHDISVNLNKKAKPSYSGDGFDLNDILYIASGSLKPCNVNVTTKAGLQTMTISHNILAMSNAGIPYSFEIVKLDPSLKATINAAGITWTNVLASSLSSALQFGNIISKLPLGDYSIHITTVDNQSQSLSADLKFTVGPAVETTPLSADPWAKHAFLLGQWNTTQQPEGLAVEYKKASESTWTKVTTGFEITNNKFKVKITGLQANTAYLFRTLSNKDVSSELSFTTQKADQIPNMSLDNWYKEGKHYFPNENSSNFWWDSGNKGANTLSEVNPTAPTTQVAVSGDGKNAAKLESKAVFGVLAAGSLYLGQYNKTIGTSGAELFFGRPYTCRPLSLQGYYSYKPATINKTSSKYSYLSGQPDFCQIYVLLADWGDWYRVNTSEGRFIDFENDNSIIAFGEMTKNVDSNGYQKFEIPLVYRNDRIPTHCVIVASSSKYGDFFTGAVGSVLLVDELEFTF